MIRNPMHTGTIVFFVPTVIPNFNTLNMLVYTILIITLLLKNFSYEQFLEQRFGLDYKLYKKETYRLIPFVF
jgi:protein-S-isoprenylcysteine O-methyltransferase Ste14